VSLVTRFINILRSKTSETSQDEYFQSIAESIPQMVWGATAEGTANYFNKNWYAYFGKVQNLDHDWHWRKFIHPDDLDKTLQAYFGAIRSEKSYEAEYRLRDKNGNYRWFLSRGDPVRDRQNKIIRWVGTATDINDQKEAIRLRDESLAAQTLQQRALEEAIGTRDDFISLASHELKTPLTSLLLQIQLHKRLLKKDSPDLSHTKLEKLIQNFDTQVLRLSRLIEDMVDASSFKPLGMTLNKSFFDLSELVRKITDYFPHANIILDLQKNISGSWDHFRIEQVLHNFLTNAVKYAENSQIFVQVFKKNQWAYIVVEDAGPGIHLDDQVKIFKPFERAVCGKKIGGLGLGLYLVEQIVTAHKGEVQIDSELGKGAKFTVKLPYTQLEVAHDCSHNRTQIEKGI
jgi:PAS domain S-box-containing protein